ncbi:hypothetical protein EX30DRAFT_388572 [Ascodesmis nigricans]|uniref:Uncharacterized protein n=1 Tax=Ascodesmis nigricans TaxID=341454 RepID=A0A4S2N008_9PEZI|nr:hypothetical protein EX30DRAFT_388572 [Ascodesmis nigricans]
MSEHTVTVTLSTLLRTLNPHATPRGREVTYRRIENLKPIPGLRSTAQPSCMVGKIRQTANILEDCNVEQWQGERENESGGTGSGVNGLTVVGIPVIRRSIEPSMLSSSDDLWKSQSTVSRSHGKGDPQTQAQAITLLTLLPTHHQLESPLPSTAAFNLNFLTVSVAVKHQHPRGSGYGRIALSSASSNHPHRLHTDTVLVTKPVPVRRYPSLSLSVEDNRYRELELELPDARPFRVVGAQVFDRQSFWMVES